MQWAAYHRFDVRFEPLPLREDLRRIAPGDWVPHYNTRDHDGPWDGVALRAAAGSHSPLYAGASADAHYADTAILQRSPALRAVLDWFRTPLRSVRLLRLGPGASVREHCDPHLGLDDGEARLHVSVLTNPHVEFYLDGRRLVMGEGELWYLDLSRPHRIKNRGNTERVHLVIDCAANDWLRSLIPAQADPALAHDQADAAAKDLEAFRAEVHHDPSLQEQLRTPNDLTDLRALVVRIGRERGFDFDAGDVEDALRASQRAWFERTAR